MEDDWQDTPQFGTEHPECQHRRRGFIEERDMTVQELYDLTRKKADPRKVELRLHPDDDEIAEVEFHEDDGEIHASLVPGGAIHL
jgi:hypothetical protein